MSKFKIGDKVRAYSADGSASLDQVGVVKNAHLGTLYVDTGLESTSSWYHEKQCRRLKPKAKPREVWVNTRFLDLGCAHEARDESNMQVLLKFKPADPLERWVLMRETKK